ncbi:Rhodanese-related sulfurtransferase [Paraoerskovia marina]|uniref:Rhodanese-related sulfurtransferase n=1 Tax=Paraoerskovia marina TaxID=545619 RepID=A0A1H1LSU2_9CELL|nr:rhodanese-like domain-containing protein [Paraoerskovia marina]SDR77412.1 Rhodanese-related sulfurtransferase [Paraoerskovia marina]SDS92845.1 Rhodanese-related sulfurtransferase [Paraoerskovia marina]
MSTPDIRPADGFAGHITPQDAWEILATDERAVLVDVRTEGEWRTIGVADVSSLDKETVYTPWVTQLGPNPHFLDPILEAGVTPGDGRTLVFLCRSGNRSIGAAAAATAAGLGPAYNVLEGFEGDADALGVRNQNGWRVAGLPSTTWTSA